MTLGEMRGDQGLEFYTVWGRGFKCRSTAHVLFYRMTMEKSTCSTKLEKENEGIAEITYSFFFSGEGNRPTLEFCIFFDG